MTDEQRILKLAQSIYLAKNNRRNDIELSGEEYDDFLNTTIDWVNQYIEELELETDWNYVRTNDYEVATITNINTPSIELEETIQRLVVSPYRDLVVLQDGTTISRFKIVNPNQIADPENPDTEDRCTVIGPKGSRKLIFSRDLKDTELNGTIVADVIEYMPELSLEDASLLDIVEPLQLIVFGVAKNSTLPDIVQGGISPSLTQKYADLLQKAKEFNSATSVANYAPREDFSFVRGDW